jgi:hypothetical protein
MFSEWNSVTENKRLKVITDNLVYRKLSSCNLLNEKTNGFKLILQFRYYLSDYRFDQ